MNYFQYINTNIDRIKFDIRIGLITCTILKHWQIYSRFDYYRKLGHPVGLSIMFTGDDYKVHDSWIYCIVKKMEKEI
jgi:hypothetical protein